MTQVHHMHIQAIQIRSNCLTAAFFIGITKS